MGIEIRDDRAVSWTNLGERAGSFARALSDRERDALERALASARVVDPEPPEKTPRPPIAPSGQREELRVEGGLVVSFDPHEPIPEGVAKLTKVLRKLDETLGEHPVAAIELEVRGKPLGARLLHVGAEPLAVRMESCGWRPCGSTSTT